MGDIEYCYYAYVDIKANLQESPLSFHRVGSGDHTQLARLGSEHPPHGALLPAMLGSLYQPDSYRDPQLRECIHKAGYGQACRAIS